MILAISTVLMVWTVTTIGLQTTGQRMHARLACVSGLTSQVLWLVFDYYTGAWGLMPLALILGVLYVRGWRKWGESETVAA